MAYIGVSPSNGVRRVHTYTATASQTTFSGAGAEGTSLSYKDSNFVDVYQNGVKLGDADYTATSGTSIVLGTGASASDLVVIVVFDVFSVVDTVSKADGGTFDGAVTFAGGVSGVLDADDGITVDNITIDGTEIDLSSGDLTVDVAGDIILDADGGDIILKDGGTEFGNIANSSSDLQFVSIVSDKDIIFRGNDGGSFINALTLDMSEEGQATFNSSIVVANTVAINSSNTSAFVQASDNAFQIGTSSEDSMQFFTNNSEAVRITSGQKFQAGTTSLTKGITNVNRSSNDPATPAAYFSGDGASNVFLSFGDTSGTLFGNIRRSGSGTAFNTSSDYRLKENISYDFDATTRLKQLKPARFNFIADADITVDGFLAHEVSSIVPEAISGKKDATQDIGTIKDSKGNVIEENTIESEKGENQTWEKTGTENVYQQIDQSKLIPLLTKTLQEALTRIDTLEAEVKALKGE